jgi:hypothetical protein
VKNIRNELMKQDLVLIPLLLLLIGCKMEPMKIANKRTSVSNDRTFTYAVEKVQGWDVRVKDTLWLEKPKLVREVFDILTVQLRAVIDTLPTQVVERLRTIPIYVTDTRSAPSSTHVHNAASWLLAHGEDEEKVLAIDIADPEKLRSDVNLSRWVLLNNLALAYQGRFLSAKERIELWEMHRAALDSGKYGVLPYEGYMRRSWSASSPTAYFAETSIAYWAHNSGYPFNRKDLLEYDPKMYAFLERVWTGPRE